MFVYIIITLTIFLALWLWFLLLLKSKIDFLENHIKNLFNLRVNIIPSIFEVSLPALIKHDEIFKEIIKLRKASFSERSLDKKLNEIIRTELLIHNELNFIFKICNKHHKLLINSKFIYIRELLISNSSNIWKNIKIYKEIINKYNFFINLKNYSIIWLLIPINKKERI